jgi:hypothetical protein
MLSPVYIKAARSVCAQDTFTTNALPDLLADAVDNALYYQHPDYSRYFSIMQLRRMSRLTRTGMVAAIECLRDAGIGHPHAIITGTGKGSLSDTEKFIQNIREYNEGTLNPTPFIQSTYNALNGLIGLHHDTDCYNTTYVHRGFSLEHAMIDAMLLFGEKKIENALVGSFEEMTPEHFIIKQKLGYWKKEILSCNELLASRTPGSIAGEGTFFFAIDQQPSGALSKLAGLRLLFEPSFEEVNRRAEQLLKENSIGWNDLDLVILGYNGDIRSNEYYDAFASQLSTETQQLAFKQICGEFDTASGFALWSASHILKDQRVPLPMKLNEGKRDRIQHVMIYNHYYGKQHVLYLLEEVH